MKRFLLITLFAVSILRSWGQDIPARPSPPKLVNDLVGVLDAGQIQALENKLDVFDDSTSVQIAVVIVSSTGGYDPVDYSVKLGRSWGVGNKDFNNGVVFLIAKDDHKTFIAPGYGLEGAIPDITCKTIIDNQILPSLKEGDYYAGIDSGVNAIMLAAKGEYKAPAGYHQHSSGGAGIGIVFLIIAVVIMIIFISGRGGGGGGYMSRRGYWGGPILWGVAGGLLGGGGGSSGGGGGGGGGFGGFGGGGFGGGGAGGSW